MPYNNVVPPAPYNNTNADMNYGISMSRTMQPQGPPMQVVIPNVFGEDGKPVTITKKNPNEPPSKTLNRIEKKRGVPMSKSGLW